MNVKKFIEELSKLDQEMEVMMSSDGEGNSYNKLYSWAEDGVYDNDTGDMKFISHGADGNCLTKEEFEGLKKQPRCVVFFPG